MVRGISSCLISLSEGRLTRLLIQVTVTCFKERIRSLPAEEQPESHPLRLAIYRKTFLANDYIPSHK